MAKATGSSAGTRFIRDLLISMVGGTLPDAWRYWVSARTGWPGTLRVGDIACVICNFSLTLINSFSLGLNSNFSVSLHFLSQLEQEFLSEFD